MLELLCMNKSIIICSLNVQILAAEIFEVSIRKSQRMNLRIAMTRQHFDTTFVSYLQPFFLDDQPLSSSNIK